MTCATGPPWPQLFEGCGFRAVHPDAARLRQAIEDRGLAEAQAAELRRRLMIDE